LWQRFFSIVEAGLVKSISVIIPAYNRAHLPGETLRSLLAQTSPAAGVIMADDGYTENRGFEL
jgi:cellulose synthase/poly-beta-1,6-N-acetylglucosamine synthase-like glycosyltransferase